MTVQKTASHWQLLAILALAFALRLYHITNPVLDWHAFRQADTASVTREYVKHGVDLLRPKYQDHSNIQTGKDNPEGYRLVEFPLVNGFIAVILRTFPHLSLVLVSRLVSVLFSLGAIVALYYLVRELSGKQLATWSALAMATLPYAVYYSRAILPEPALLVASLTSLVCFTYYIKKPSAWWASATWLSLALALLLKPFAIFLAPVYLLIAWQKRGWKIVLSWDLALLAAAVVAPLLAWRHWISTFPTGIPASDWLFNGNGIRFRPAWFRWLFWERITKLILGGVGILFALANLLQLPQLKTKQWWQQDWLIYAGWWAGILAYFAVIASGNVQHDYYQVIALPIICITLARGLLIFASALTKKFKSVSITTIAGIGLALCCWGSWTQVGGYFNINHWEYVAAGKAVDELTPADALVIAPAFGDTLFLFQTNRTGWPIGFEIADKIAKGAQYYITTSYDDEARALEAEYATVKKTPEYLLLNLTQPL
jgi:hypothetical protein